jgi:putative PIN family toxin of toxin-antitoxin system
MRAVFDTNIVVSSLIFGGRLTWLRRAWSGGEIVPIICRQTASELLRVLAYPKFRLGATDRAGLLEDYLPYADIFSLPDPIPPLAVTCRDRNDAIFLSLAIAAGVPLVSGDADLTVLGGTLPIQVLSVTQLRERLTD